MSIACLYLCLFVSSIVFFFYSKWRCVDCLSARTLIKLTCFHARSCFLNGRALSLPSCCCLHIWKQQMDTQMRAHVDERPRNGATSANSANSANSASATARIASEAKSTEATFSGTSYASTTRRAVPSPALVARHAAQR